MITAKVKGMTELSMKIAALQHECKEMLKEASLAAAEPVRDTASNYAARSDSPTKAGHLADHIEIQVEKSTPTSCLVKVGPDRAHFYGPFLEYGTVKMAAQPFMRPAMDTEFPEALSRFAAVCKRRVTSPLGGLL